ncbi:hypothetical protein IMCC14465_10580 [alpha proteobacterium IMCC14465]|uniref:Uncharacterized protein n=1 Tax=alpha proteobacterium IMCC14465 TaxID=1220535 RepID=J9DW64_9PROT|nr:hypothetical protein IMCC14465_10580 [alpha proteobacterium IMCC14465]
MFCGTISHIIYNKYYFIYPKWPYWVQQLLKKLIFAVFCTE